MSIAQIFDTYADFAKADGAEATVIVVRMPDGSTMAQTWHADVERAEWLADMASKARDLIWPDDEDEEDAT